MKLSTKLFLAGTLMIAGAVLVAIGLVALSAYLQVEVPTEGLQTPLITFLLYVLPGAVLIAIGGGWHQRIQVAKDKARTQAFINSLSKN